ncbi:MAG: accessory gene regulator AgrB [Lentilactobacillus diolivorans]
METALSKLILDKLFKSDHLISEQEYEVANYHLSILIINLEKCLVVYAFAIVFHALISTVCIHSVFVLLRRYAGGWHAASSLNCTLVSVAVFVILPMIMGKFIGEIPLWISIVLQSLILLTVMLYAPADTEKNPLFGKRRREKMRTRAIVLVIILTACYYAFLTADLKIAMLLGELSECFMIHPLFYN